MKLNFQENAFQLIRVKLKNSPENVNDLIYLSRWAKLCDIHRAGRKSTPFPQGSEFAGQIFIGELSKVDLAEALEQGL